MISYELRCRNCGYHLHFSQGVLMSFQKTNEELLKRMKQGEFGEDFKRIANENPNAKADHSRELFRCPECGTLKGEAVIALRDECYNTLIEIPHSCKKCNTKMELINTRNTFGDLDIPCPSCKEKLFGPFCEMCVD